MSDPVLLPEVHKKLEYYCSYQERCHQDVEQKLYSFQLTADERNEIIVKLIADNYLNEERFASLFTISKLHQKKWGKVRIKIELKARKISDYLINQSLKQIPDEEYQNTFDTLSEKYYDTLLEKNAFKKRKKFCDYLLRKGWESDLVYSKAKKLEQ
ncbi:regulatory protein RecX [Flavobacterium sp.]